MDDYEYTGGMYDRFRRSRGSTTGAGGVATDPGLDGTRIEDDRSIGEVVSDLTRHTQELVRGELDLFKQEMSAKAKAAAAYAGMAAGAAILALTSLVFLGHTIAQALNLAMPAWAAYLITTLLYLGVAAALGMAAKKGFEKTNLAPEQSVEQAKEDVQWVKTHS